MAPPLYILLLQLVFSGLIAATVSFLLNRHDERRRAARDYITKLFDSARDDVSTAIDAGVAYYTGTYVTTQANKLPPDNVRFHEARLLLSETNLRHAIAGLGDISRLERVGLDSLIPLERDFIAALTEHYGEANPASPAHARSVVLRGAPLRQKLAQLRQDQLRTTSLGIVLRRGTLLMIVLLLIAALNFALGFYTGSLLER